VLFFAEDDFTLADELIVEPQAVFVGGTFEAGAWRAAEEADARGRLKNIGRERAAIDVEFDAKIAGVGHPGNLIAGIENDNLGDKSNEYGSLSHFFCDCETVAANSPREKISP
jgi:hypothetical protein